MCLIAGALRGRGVSWRQEPTIHEPSELHRYMPCRLRLLYSPPSPSNPHPSLPLLLLSKQVPSTLPQTVTPSQAQGTRDLSQLSPVMIHGKKGSMVYHLSQASIHAEYFPSLPLLSPQRKHSLKCIKKTSSHIHSYVPTFLHPIPPVPHLLQMQNEN
jgi:hypothetical protein